LISAYLDKRVTAEEQKFFERHIASCADCRAQLEVTRSLVTALRAMPTVKAPRSFVLPREMAKQPKRSFLSLYPALRLATVVAALAFVVLFAGDVLSTQLGSSNTPQFNPIAAPARVAMQAPAAPPEAAPTQELAAAEAYSATATAPAELAAPSAGSAANMSETAVMTESMMAQSVPTATPEATAVADVSNQAQMRLKATPESTQLLPDQQAAPAAEQPAEANRGEVTPTIDTLRIAEIAVLVLAVVLGIATLAARRKQT
jgi:predicted anti-sigma-YlaC factor YlaD